MRTLLLIALAALALAACGPTTTDDADAGSDIVTCQSDPRVTAWKEGLSETSGDGKVRVVVQSSNPTNPIRGINTWTVAVEDANGAPLETPTVAVKPWMPDHGHGSSVDPTVSPAGGGYSIGNLYLFMAGVWQIQFTVTPTSGSKEIVTFDLCIAG